MPRRTSLGKLVNQSTMLLMVCIGGLILILAVLILLHENASATKGYRLRSLERDRSVLLLEQEVLNMQIAESQALEHLKTDPQIASMVAPTKPLYAKAEPAPTPPAASAVTAFSGSTVTGSGAGASRTGTGKQP